MKGHAPHEDLHLTFPMMTSLPPALSASGYRSDIEVTFRFAEETDPNKVFEQHFARKHDSGGGVSRPPFSWPGIDSLVYS
jgi:hypothetical protein